LILVEFSFSLDDVKSVGLAFSDGSVRRVSEKDASEILKRETGYSYREWREFL